jgi:hypothetical protein
MALQFSHSPVVILKRSLETKLIDLRLRGDQHAIRLATNLLNGELVDDYLVGIDDMMDDDETTHQMLAALGLTWNDGNECVDYFMPNLYPAQWLECFTLPLPTRDDPAWRFGVQEAYRHIDDTSGKLIKPA